MNIGYWRRASAQVTNKPQTEATEEPRIECRPSRTTRNRHISNSLPTHSSLGSLLSSTDLISAVEVGKFDIDDTATIDPVSYCILCNTDNRRASKCSQIKHLKASIRSRNGNFNYWRQQQDGYSSKLSAHAIGNRHMRNQEDRTSQPPQHRQ